MDSEWTVLAPICSAADAGAAAEHAIRTAAALRGRITLLHVQDDPQSLSLPAGLPPFAATRLRSIALTGTLAETISSHAALCDARLICLTAQRGWFRRKSWVDELTRCLGRPVCIQHESALRRPRPGPFRKVVGLVMLDGSDQPVVAEAAAIASRCGSELVLVHVLPEISEALLAYGLPAAGERPLSQPEAERRMAELSASLAFPHRTTIVTGDWEHTGDLVVASHSGFTLQLGRRLACPLVSVPANYAPPRSADKTPAEEISYADRPLAYARGSISVFRSRARQHRS